MEPNKYDTTGIDFEISVYHSELFDWRVVCEYLSISVDSLSAVEAINLVSTIVQVLEAMYP